jgi:hypothetical protein
VALIEILAFACIKATKKRMTIAAILSGIPTIC